MFFACTKAKISTAAKNSIFKGQKKDFATRSILELQMVSMKGKSYFNIKHFVKFGQELIMNHHLSRNLARNLKCCYILEGGS